MILVGLATQNKGVCRDCKWRDRIYREVVYKMESDQGGGMGDRQKESYQSGRLEKGWSATSRTGRKKKVGASYRRNDMRRERKVLGK